MVANHFVGCKHSFNKIERRSRMALLLSIMIYSCVSTAVVRSKTPDLSEEPQNTTRQIDGLKAELKELRKSLEAQASIQKFILQLTFNSLFRMSDVFEGRRYYLIRHAASFTQSSAQDVCRMYGGYLAEIDTNEEFNFVRKFLATNPNYKLVMTGGSDEEEEGKWVNIHSKTPLKVFNWSPAMPFLGRKGNCQCFWDQGDWYMPDCFCTMRSIVVNFRYICEIPV
ncbi:hypothetical protein Btru_033829 [Bulinus truncatus]|nr:hypothetical protein Btru_033829 [Bulinus truncatus]